MHQSHLIAEYLYLERLAKNMDIVIVCCDTGFTLYYRAAVRLPTHLNSVRDIREYLLKYEHSGNYLNPHIQKQVADSSNSATIALQGR